MLFHNFRTDYVGYNQIRTVFDPEYVWIGTFRVTTKSLSIIFVQEITTARLTGMGLIMKMKKTRNSHMMVVVTLTSF